jgi:hypothetical protein
MNSIQMIWLGLQILFFAVWVFCMISWVRRGAKFPRWIHVLALSLTGLGVCLVVVSYFLQMLSVPIVVSCLLLPPVFAYGGWLWMFGPSEGE